MQDLDMAVPQSEAHPSPDLSVTELTLPARIRNLLLNSGLNTVGDVLNALARGEEELLNIKGFGPKSLVELKKCLAESGLLASASPVSFAPQAPVSTQTPQSPAATVPVSAPPAEPMLSGQRLDATITHLRDMIRSRVWVYGAIVVAIMILICLLPGWLGLTGYEALTAASNSASHPDGITLSVDQATFTGRLRVHLSSIPRLQLLEGSVGSELRQAVAALPSHLTVKSPLYLIKIRGRVTQPVTIDVLVPNDAEPWETLDLYTWTGESWEWVGGELHTEEEGREFLRARVSAVPANVVVVQAGPVAPRVSATWEAGDQTVEAAAGLVDEVNPLGLFLGLDGGLVGDPDGLLQPVAGGNYQVVPVVRNWAPDGTVNRGLLLDVLTLPEVQAAHIASLVRLCQERGYGGVEVDYRGLRAEERELYTRFIAALAGALHAVGKRLNVVVENPEAVAGGWETGGYDWAALGEVADVVKVPFPGDPRAYEEGGEVQRLLEWSVGQVNRYRLHMQVSSLSVEAGGDGERYVALDEVLVHFGRVVARDGVTRVEPGGRVSFGLEGNVRSITYLEGLASYQLEYPGEDGGIRTAWLGSGGLLGRRLEWARRYHLGGVAVSGLLAPGNMGGVLEAVAAYRSGGSGGGGALPEVEWTVTSAEATVDRQAVPLTAPDYTWMVLAAEGEYTVRATIAGSDHGSVPIVVARPEPEPTPVITTTGGSLASQEHITSPVSQPEVGGGATTAECLNARWVKDVTVPDNTRFEKGKEFDKTWRVRNTGTCSWPADTVLAFVSGAKLDAPDSVPVGPLEPGEEIDVTVKMKAPDQDGNYTGIWKMRTAQGPFGGNLTVVIVVGEGTPATPVVAPVSGGGFELGGHVRDIGHPYASLMHYAGMTWSKVQVHYGEDASGIIQVAHANGFKIQLSALGRPGMVVEPGFEQNFANWVASLAKAGADAIEVWNEPNIDREWQIGYISPQAYTKLLCASYNAIKAANPGTAVISAAPAPTGWFGGCSPNGCDDKPWMEGLFNAGAANCMDYIGAHHNAGATSPSATSGHPGDNGSGHHSWYFLPQTQLYYNIFRGTRKLFYTEMGYASQEGVPTFSDAFAWARGTNNAQQAAWLAEAVQLSIRTGMVRCIIVWNIDFVRYGYDPQDGYAIVRPDGSCPACVALHGVLGTR